MSVQAIFAAGTHRPAAPVLSFGAGGVPGFGLAPVAIVIDVLQVRTPAELARQLDELVEFIASDRTALHSLTP